jgi:dienelactone hydrolase
VGQFAGMSRFGALDMAGNVREWCWNATGSRRFFRGGGWNDPFWVSLQETQAQNPFDRTATNGFRLAEYPDTTHLARAREPLPEPSEPDYVHRVPTPDREFEIYRRQFSYDATPLRARIEAVDTTRDWIRERISIDAAYGGERVVLYLYLPVGGRPPLQTVVYFPGGAARLLASVDDYRSVQFDFLVKSGRALAFPVYKGTFQRPADSNAGPNSTRDRVIQTVKDLRRTVDYLRTRTDLASDELAYFGYSFGGSWAPFMLANEDRFNAAVLYVGGFAPGRGQPPGEIDPFNYLPRVTTPVLMLNGKTDQNRQPIEQKVYAFFDRLGTPADRKRLVVEEGGHFVPRPTLIRETLHWLDRFLGRVD